MVCINACCFALFNMNSSAATAWSWSCTSQDAWHQRSQVIPYSLLLKGHWVPQLDQHVLKIGLRGFVENKENSKANKFLIWYLGKCFQNAWISPRPHAAFFFFFFSLFVMETLLGNKDPKTLVLSAILMLEMYIVFLLSCVRMQSVKANHQLYSVENDVKNWTDSSKINYPLWMINYQSEVYKTWGYFHIKFLFLLWYI